MPDPAAPSARSNPAGPLHAHEGLPGRWKILGAVVFGLFMVLLDATVVNVAFQTLRAEYGRSLSQAQWVLSVYTLALGMATPLAGFLGDRFGVKRTYLAGIAIFVLGSLACGFAPTLEWLVAARVLQGIGGGLALPLGTAQLFRAFPPREQGLALGVFGIAILMGPALGPVVGGYLVTVGLWRWIFFVNLPIGLVGLVLGARWLVEARRDRAPTFPALSTLLSIVGFGSVLYAATRAADAGWTSTAVLGWGGLGLATLAVFAIREWRQADPLLDLRLYRNPTFLAANLVGYVAMVALFGAEFLLPLYLQTLRGLTPLETGLRLLPVALGAGIATPLAGWLYDRIGPRPLVVTGYAVLLVNTFQLAGLAADTPLRWIGWLLLMRGLAIGLTVQSTLAVALGVVPPPQVPRASSLINATRQTVQAFAVAILATVLVSTLSPDIRAFQQRMFEAHPGAVQHLPGLCAVPEGPLGAMSMGLPMAAAPLLRRACVEGLAGFDHAYMLTFYATIAAFLLAFFLPGWPGRWTGRKGDRSAALEAAA